MKQQIKKFEIITNRIFLIFICFTYVVNSGAPNDATTTETTVTYLLLSLFSMYALYLNREKVIQRKTRWYETAILFMAIITSAYYCTDIYLHYYHSTGEVLAQLLLPVITLITFTSTLLLNINKDHSLKKSKLLIVFHLMIPLVAFIANYGLLILIATFNPEMELINIHSGYPCIDYYNKLIHCAYLLFELMHIFYIVYPIMGIYRFVKGWKVNTHLAFEILMISMSLIGVLFFFIYEFTAPLSVPSSWEC